MERTKGLIGQTVLLMLYCINDSGSLNQPLDDKGVKYLLKTDRERAEQVNSVCSLWKMLGRCPHLNQFFSDKVSE